MKKSFNPFILLLVVFLGFAFTASAEEEATATESEVVSDNDATELDKLTGTGHALTIVANDASFPATKLSAYDAVTTLPVTLGNVIVLSCVGSATVIVVS